MKTLIDFIYTVLIGIAVAVFVGLGIWTFYSGPKSPEYPNYPTGSQPSETQQKEFEKQQQQFDTQMKDYQKEEKPYSKKVSAIALSAGAVFFTGGLLLMRKNDIVGEGLALGGIFTEIYAAGRAASASFKPVVFAAVSLVLTMLVILVLNRGGTFWPAKTRARK